MIELPKLTRAERDLLAAFEQAVRQHGDPSIREIHKLAGGRWWPSSVHAYLKRLEAKGYVCFLRPPRTRGIRLLYTAEGTAYGTQ